MFTNMFSDALFEVILKFWVDFIVVRFEVVWGYFLMGFGPFYTGLVNF